MGLELCSICLKMDVISVSRGMKRPLRIALCKESCYNLINALDPFSFIFQPWNFYIVNFTDTSSAGKTARKITKILQSFGFCLEFKSFKLVKYAWCCEFSNVGTFFWLTRYFTGHC